MCACVMRTAFIERGSNGGSCQLRSRSSFRPWNIPQSTSTRALFVWTRYFDPVTVPTPPQNSILANDQLLPSSAITEPDNQHRNQQRQISQRCLDSELTGNDAAEAATLEWLTMKPVNVIKRVRRKTNQQHRRKERANSHRARHDQQYRRYDLRRYDDNRCGPRPALVIESRRAQQLTHVLDERVDDRELRNRSEQKQRRQSIATYT